MAAPELAGRVGLADGVAVGCVLAVGAVAAIVDAGCDRSGGELGVVAVTTEGSVVTGGSTGTAGALVVSETAVASLDVEPGATVAGERVPDPSRTAVTAMTSSVAALPATTASCLLDRPLHAGRRISTARPVVGKLAATAPAAAESVRFGTSTGTLRRGAVVIGRWFRS